MKAETLETYRPLLRSILSLEGFQFENVFSFRVKGEDIVDALSGKSQFFDIGTKGNKLLKSLYQQWKTTQRPPSVVLKDHIMSIFPIQEDVDGMDFLGMLRDRKDGELTSKEESLIQLLCAVLTSMESMPALSPSPDAATKVEIERLQTTLDGERSAYQKEMRQILIRTRELEESLRVAEENVSSFQKLAEELQEAAAREQQLRLSVEEELHRRDEEDRSKGGQVSPEQSRGLAALDLEREDMTRRLQTAESELSEVQGNLEQLEEARSSENIQHSNEIDTLMGDLSQTQLRERDLAARIEELEAAQKAADSSGGTSSHDIQALRDEVEKLRDVLTMNEAAFAKQDDDLQQEKEITARTFSELEDARNQRDDLELKNESLLSQIAELQKSGQQLRELQTTLDGVKADRDQLATEVAALQDEAAANKVLGDKVEELEESLHIMQGRFQEASDLLGTLIKSRDKYRTILDSQVNPIFLLDRNLVILHLNRAMLSYTQEHQFQQIIGKRCYEALGLSGICKGCPILKSIETGQLEGNLVTMDMPDEKRLFSVCAYPTLDAKTNITAITEFMEDVTDRAAIIEKVKKLNEEREKLIEHAETTPMAYLRFILDSLGTREKSTTEIQGDDFAIKIT